MFTVDIIRYICKYLSDININSFLSSDITLYKFKKQIKFKQLHILTSKIYLLSYYDSFINLKIIKATYNIYLGCKSDDKYYRLKKTKIMPFTLPNNLKKITIPEPNAAIMSIIIPQIKRSIKKFSIIFNLSDNLIMPNVNMPITHLTITKKYVFSNVDSDIFFNNIPQTVQHLIIDTNSEFKNGCVPLSVRHLTFGNFFNIELTSNNIHPFIEYLYVDNYHYKHKLNYLPENLTHLKAPNSSIQNRNIFPKSLKNLDIIVVGDHENIIPLSVSHLKISGVYPVEKKLPYGISHLTISNYFNSVYDIIPDSVTHLIFEKKIGHVLIPKSVKYLTIPKKYCQQLSDEILLSVKITYT